MTGGTKPSEEEAADFEWSVSVIPVKENKEEEKTMMLSSALVEPVIKSKEDWQISANCDKIASDIGGSGNDLLRKKSD